MYRYLSFCSLCIERGRDIILVRFRSRVWRFSNLLIEDRMVPTCLNKSDKLSLLHCQVIEVCIKVQDLESVTIKGAHLQCHDEEIPFKLSGLISLFECQ